MAFPGVVSFSRSLVPLTATVVRLWLPHALSLPSNSSDRTPPPPPPTQPPPHLPPTSPALPRNLPSKTFLKTSSSQHPFVLQDSPLVLLHLCAALPFPTAQPRRRVSGRAPDPAAPEARREPGHLSVHWARELRRVSVFGSVTDGVCAACWRPAPACAGGHTPRAPGSGPRGKSTHLWARPGGPRTFFLSPRPCTCKGVGVGWGGGRGRQACVGKSQLHSVVHKHPPSCFGSLLGLCC